MLFDKVENSIKGKKEDKIVKNLFQGVLANEFICKGCPHYSEREEPFLAISLQVKNKHSIKESLDSFVEGEMLEGDNAYYCEKCEKKVNTLKRCCIKRMPNVLFMVLKRFEFNYDTMTKIKINDYCEFPMKINMSEYSQETLSKKDLIKEMEDKNLTLEDLTEEQRQTLEKSIPSKYYDYNLKGAVVHLGTADQGHYISII
jgi:ubiquitin carboxyl-terminal hydrolase 9/24